MGCRSLNISKGSLLSGDTGRLDEAVCTLHVCTSCRPKGCSREPREDRPGFILHQILNELIQERDLLHRVNLQPAECLSLCARPCGIALSSKDSWTYLFGDQDPNQTAEDILNCVSVYLESSKGNMPRERRPKTLRASILGRVPPHHQIESKPSEILYEQR